MVVLGEERLLPYSGKIKDHEMGNPNEEASEPESESESEDEENLVKLSEPSKESIYNKEGLLDKLEDIIWPDSAKWIDKLTVDIDREEREVDVNDDLARELFFYTQALDGTREAFQKLQPTGLPFLRPPDYYAEMVKSDGHMEKVKSRLLLKKREIEEAEERRKAREAKKIAKEVQAQKLKERAKQKKAEIESVKKWRKQRKQSGFAADDKDGGPNFEDGKPFSRSNKVRPGAAPGDRSGGKGRLGGKGGRKREIKNFKFGHGGRKGLKKQNTAETTNDFRGFRKGGSVPGNKKRKR